MFVTDLSFAHRKAIKFQLKRMHKVQNMVHCKMVLVSELSDRIKMIVRNGHAQISLWLHQNPVYDVLPCNTPEKNYAMNVYSVKFSIYLFFPDIGL